jgi:large subunit ribosomal protein L22
MRVAPRKARRVVDLIRGLPAAEARAVLAFAPQSAAEGVGKVLASAIANAGQGSRGAEAEDLVVSRVWVDEGPTQKRFRPRAQGRAYRINKRTSHITVIVSDETGQDGTAGAAAAAGSRAAGRARQPGRRPRREAAGQAAGQTGRKGRSR